jgi:DNA-binding XRE family transcriptional regulator
VTCWSSSRAPSSHRARLGLAEDERAARVGVSTRTIRAIDAGWHRPRVDLAVALAREVEAPVERLFPPCITRVTPAGAGGHEDDGIHVDAGPFRRRGCGL